MRYFFASIMFFCFNLDPSIAQVREDGFNNYILMSVQRIVRDRANGGYDLKANFTKDLTYVDKCCVKATKPTATQCVAAVAEIIIEAINIYAQEHGNDIAQRLPMKVWTGGSRSDLRPYIWKYDGVQSNGTADALRIFGIGAENSFAALRPGDFVTFNRKTSGHSVVFLGYLNGDGDVVPSYTDSVVGFKYFSAQGRGKPDAGFAYRWAFFEGSCPMLDASRPRDCGVIRSSDRRMFDTGYMFTPDKWRSYAQTVEQIRQQLLSDRIQNTSGPLPDSTRLLSEVQRDLDATLPDPDLSRFTGETTD
jgi:hypothetical protein